MENPMQNPVDFLALCRGGIHRNPAELPPDDPPRRRRPSAARAQRPEEGSDLRPKRPVAGHHEWKADEVFVVLVFFRVLSFSPPSIF